MKTARHQLNTTLLLKETLGVLRINLASFLTVAVLTMGFFMLVSLSSVLLIPVGEGSTLRETWASTPWPLKAGVFVGAFAFLALLVRAMATTVYLASESCERGDARIRRAVGQIRRRNLGIIWFCGLASTMLSLFFFVPVILAALFIAPAIPAGLLEDLRWSQAIARARALNKGSYGRLLVLFLLTTLLFMAVLLSWRMLFAFLETLLPWAPVRNLTLFVPLLLVTQSWMIALTLHFHDRRAREAKSQGVAK